MAIALAGAEGARLSAGHRLAARRGGVGATAAAARPPNPLLPGRRGRHTLAL